MQRKHIAVLTMACAALISGCASSNHPTAATTSPSAPIYASSYGVVDSIQLVQGSSGGNTMGTVAGGVVGGLLGHQVGEGRGNTAATVAGAVGGAMVGNEMTKNGQQQTYQIGVRLDNGSYQTIAQDAIGDLRVGSRVRIENGRVYSY